LAISMATRDSASGAAASASRPTRRPAGAVATPSAVGVAVAGKSLTSEPRATTAPRRRRFATVWRTPLAPARTPRGAPAPRRRGLRRGAAAGETGGNCFLGRRRPCCRATRRDWHLHAALASRDGVARLRRERRRPPPEGTRWRAATSRRRGDGRAVHGLCRSEKSARRGALGPNTAGAIIGRQASGGLAVSRASSAR
jgi:hypothetical protein